MGYRFHEFAIPDVKGMGMIERLLRHPGGEIASYDLIHGPTAIEVNAGPEHSDFEPNAFVATKFSHSGEMLDKQAKREYQLRLAVLEEQLAELKATGDPEQALEVEAEIEFLRREISRAFAFGGRSRRAGLATERARLNATRAIRAALLKISDQNAEFGQQLSASIRTGLFCCYQPRHDRKIIWELSDDSRNASPAQAMDLLDAVPPMPIAALTSGSIFIGRKNELEILRSLLNRIRRGEGTIALLSGEPGVGKTRTAAEIAIIATELGMLAFAGSCYDRDDLIPYLPFVQILERIVAAWKQPRRLQELLGYDASEIARLVPAIHGLVPDVSRPLEVAPEQSQRILFNAVAGFLTRVAATQP